MKLTKNEKKTLKLLIENARVTDSDIAHKLKISSQAVGKIRKKLEKTVIKGYETIVDYSKMGLETFALAIGKVTPEGLHMGGLEIEQKIIANPHIINAFRIPLGSTTHLLMYGFQNHSELDEFFQSSKLADEIHKFIEIKEIYTFSHNSIIKSTNKQLLDKVIDATSTKTVKNMFSEIEMYKKKFDQ